VFTQYAFLATLFASLSALVITIEVTANPQARPGSRRRGFVPAALVPSESARCE
jgi:hypothetical protein